MKMNETEKAVLDRVARTLTKQSRMLDRLLLKMCNSVEEMPVEKRASMLGSQFQLLVFQLGNILTTAESVLETVQEIKEDYGQAGKLH